ncbi:hypothetical protein C8R42DRAFT_652634 [Lentinula raphanica]|nr:hypothetical protein C8R42DRAFT_652634 [Lentinula raphanica]
MSTDDSCHRFPLTIFIVFCVCFSIRGISPKKGLLIFLVIVSPSSSSSMYMCILSLAYSLSFYFYISHPSFVLQPLPPIPILARGLAVRPSCSLLGRLHLSNPLSRLIASGPPLPHSTTFTSYTFLQLTIPPHDILGIQRLCSR